mgnify:CR=1 FL=1
MDGQPILSDGSGALGQYFLKANCGARRCRSYGVVLSGIVGVGQELELELRSSQRPQRNHVAILFVPERQWSVSRLLKAGAV